jgi:Tol biopolymer transport system component
MAPEQKHLSLPAQAIEEQLTRILASHEFASAGRLSAFLEFVVHKTLEGKNHEIKEYAVGTEVFGRLESFDPRVDTIVRVQASKLRSRLIEYYADAGADDPIVIVLPRGSYVPVFHEKESSIANGPVSTDASQVVAQPSSSKSRTTAIAAIAGSSIILVAAVGFVSRMFRPPEPQQEFRFTLEPPDDTSFSGPPSISPDGKHILCPVRTAPGHDELWLRSLAGSAGHVLPGTGGVRFPGWSADGRFVIFISTEDRRVHKIDFANGSLPETVPVPSSFGVAWTRGNMVLLSGNGGGILKVPATGGPSTPVTHLDATYREGTHFWPELLPDGRHFLYSARSINPAERAIYVASLDGKVHKRLLANESRAQYVSAGTADGRGPGYLLYVREGTLFAQQFDRTKLEFTGSPKQIAEGVGQYAYGIATFSASQNGVLIYLSLPSYGSQFTWFDRTGRQLGRIGPSGICANPAISRDGKKLAFDLAAGPDRDIWITDIASGHVQRLTFDPEVDHCPVWSPDGTRIVFDSHRNGSGDLFVKATNGASSEYRLLPWLAPCGADDWSRDGKTISFTSLSETAQNDIWMLPLDKGKPFPYLQTKANEYGAKFSPNNRWVAYTSNDSGKYEVYVQAFDGVSPAGGAKWLVSENGGSEPVWRADGRELFYLTPDNHLMAVEVNTEGVFKAAAPKALFAASALSHDEPFNSYDVTPDGQRFLVKTLWRPIPPTPIHVFVNWGAVLQ